MWRSTQGPDSADRLLTLLEKEGPPDELFSRCVHCGLCTSACPTYTELFDENDSPRGRIYLMRLVSEGRLPWSAEVAKHLDLCLDCRACETACPSGVPYGRIVEPFRTAVHECCPPAWWQGGLVRWLLADVFPYRHRLRTLLFPVRMAQRIGLYQLAEKLGFFRLLPGAFREMATLLPPAFPEDKPLPPCAPAAGKPRARVGLFVGCVADVMFRHVHWATIRVLQQNGCDVFIPRGQTCCGAIHFHLGDSPRARRLADRNIAAFSMDQLDAIIVNHAGCGAMLKEYPHHWHDDRRTVRQAWSDKVRDVNEFLDELGLVRPAGAIPLTVTYHDACHLAHAQKVVDQPRRLLQKIPGIKLVELPESLICCGSAGSYNLLQREMAQRLARRKLENIRATGAEAVVASNAGCLLQIMREVRRAGFPILVLHPMELLDMAYREVLPQLPQNKATGLP
ncbi:MAG: (Fe-S)-binding protein [Thermoguttaceae bacterium]|nr:(Fe-S)-binding protein [Thermoguttaceae bacterium]MDW8079172.1 (Fe-S)-binding protein [Thermoguttaceae bacterium]